MSEEGDAAPPEPLVGNVRRTDAANRSQPAGSLVFDASFESGNLGRVDRITDTEYDLFIRPDTCNPKHRVWFYFSVENATANQRVLFNVVNFSKSRSLFEKGCAAPVVRSSANGAWVRVPQNHLFYYRSPSHADRPILAFAFVFDRADAVYEFAYCYPYTYSQLQHSLRELEARDLPHLRRDLLALSVQQRRLDLLTITEPSNLSRKQRVIVVTARVHPGESPASYVCQGLVDFLLSSDPAAVRLRQEFVFKIVPMLNPDGVHLGNYRCSLMGFDLNRHWQLPSAWAHPSILATKNLLLQYNENPQMELVFYVDLHAHSQLTDAFMYGNVFTKDAGRCERQLLLPHLLASLCDHFSLESTQFNMDAVKAGTGRRTMGAELDVSCLCYTMEVSFFSRKDSIAGIVDQFAPFLQDDYVRLGKCLALAILQYAEVEKGERSGPPLRTLESFVPARTRLVLTAAEKPRRKKTSNNSSKNDSISSKFS